ncbi:hypothetical protein AC579_5287 [Pseudocercospora musae]|uniref:YCII-related domain-containing protein n=1 Tax=Pseudocercospora musae TaxID=113226 RepID=A0A139IPJ5_9PEZI|nr:hypothetical protein AC579_5287 [Pseudocercospora musae]
MSEPSTWLVQVTADPSKHDVIRTHGKAHLEYNKSLVDSGILIFGGPTLARQPDHNADKGLQVAGYFAVLRVETELQAREAISDNPFSQYGLWDWESAFVAPFRCTMSSGGA